MLTWFRRLLAAFFRARVKRDPRATFEFWDGGRWRSVDPIAVWAALTRDLGEDLGDQLATVTTPAPPGTAGEMARKFAEARQAAAEKVAGAVCAAFGVEPYADGEGLTVPERISLAAEYLRRMAALGTAARPT